MECEDKSVASARAEIEARFERVQTFVVCLVSLGAISVAALTFGNETVKVSIQLMWVFIACAGISFATTDYWFRLRPSIKRRKAAKKLPHAQS